MTKTARIFLAVVLTAPMLSAPAFAWDPKDTDTSLNGKPQTLWIGNHGVIIGDPYHNDQQAVPPTADAGSAAGSGQTVIR